MESVRKAALWLLGPETSDPRHPGHLLPRWIFLRCLGLIYFSAFYSFLFQVEGLIGSQGILPAGQYLAAVPRVYPGVARFWFAPTLFWFSSSNHALMAVCWIGLLASLVLTFNLWPRGMLAICFICYLSFIAAAQDFSSYQSDGMLLEAGFISFFFAPPGFLPKLGVAHPPSRFSLFLLRWEWFRIYFQSGVVKLASGDYSWRHFTAMDDYYQNCPLPSWPGWYVQHLPPLVPCRHRGVYFRRRTRAVFPHVFSAAMENCLLLHRYSISNRHHSYRELHLPELPGALPRLSSSRRSLVPLASAATLEIPGADS